MVLRHASEKFRLAYELPLETHELFGAFNQFLNVTVDNLDENSYRSDILAKYDLWRTKKANNQYDELIDYRNLNETFYDIDIDENEIPDYNDDDNNNNKDSQPPLIYAWHRERHLDIKNSIFKYVDDKMYGIIIDSILLV